MQPHNIPQPVPDIIWREVDDGLILVSPQAGKIRVLNETGALIWHQLQAGKTIAAIEELLITTYSLSAEQASQDLKQFLEDLTQRGVIIWQDSSE